MKRTRLRANAIEVSTAELVKSQNRGVEKTYDERHVLKSLTHSYTVDVSQTLYAGDEIILIVDGVVGVISRVGKEGVHQLEDQFVSDSLQEGEWFVAATCGGSVFEWEGDDDANSVFVDCIELFHKIL